MKKPYSYLVFCLVIFGSALRADVLLDSPDLYLEVYQVSTVPTFSIDDSVDSEFSWSLGGQSFDDFPNQPVHFTSPSNIPLSQVVSSIRNFYEGPGFAVIVSTDFPTKTFAESSLNSQIPEPASSAALVGLFLFGLVLFRRRRS